MKAFQYDWIIQSQLSTFGRRDGLNYSSILRLLRPGLQECDVISPPCAGNALSLGLFLFPALHPSRIFLAFILILGNMNEGNQAGMQ